MNQNMMYKFEFENEEYELSFNNKPILFKNQKEQKILPLLRKYILDKNLPISLVNSKGNTENTRTIVRKVLDHFSFKLTELEKNKFENNSSSIKIKEKVKSIEKKIENPKEIKHTDFDLIDLKNKNILINCSKKKIDKNLLINKDFKLEELAFNEILGGKRKELLEKLIQKKTHTGKRNNIQLNLEQDINFNQTHQAFFVYSYGKILNSAESIRWGDYEKEKIYILSALFGIIKATDYIPIYDFAITDKIDNVSVIKYWKDGGHLDRVITELKEESISIINLLSNDYNSVLNNEHENLIDIRINWNDRGDKKGNWIKYQFDNNKSK
jgi:cytoplasmic iron level regulating protein YaaA (DUF328/UPF0246 family)